MLQNDKLKLSNHFVAIYKLFVVKYHWSYITWRLL